MPAFIRIDRVERAIRALNSWQGSVRKQSTAHVLPLLALLERGINKLTTRQFEEANDFDFFDRFCRVPGDSEQPYFDPFNRTFRIASHPHSNIATARKGTFSRSWGAARWNDGPNGETLWQLDENFASVFASKLFRSNQVARLPVVDLAVWLFRTKEFNDGASAATLETEFRRVFPFEGADYDQLFAFSNEPAQGIFQPTAENEAELTAAIRGLALLNAESAIRSSMPAGSMQPAVTQLRIAEDDPILEEIKRLIEFGTSGIILRGAPGTGKSWYAEQIALALTGADPTRIIKVQFHPSYNYEDFVEGFSPNDDARSGFAVSKKVFRTACDRASSVNGAFVLVIDEINRGNTAKIFGETLTYIEKGWRGVMFRPRLSMDDMSVPANLVVIGTMNPYDRSITALDMALLRRFDHIDIDPESERVEEFLTQAGMPASGVRFVTDWFIQLQRLLPHGLGHTFFRGVRSTPDLELVWRYRVLPFCRAMLEHEEARQKAVEDSYGALLERLREGGF